MAKFMPSVGVPVSNHWFTLTHLQECLNRENREKLRVAMREKQIPMARFGNEYIIEDADFIAWIQANKSTQPDRKKVATEATDSEAA
jgi:hypothetical protein